MGTPLCVPSLFHFVSSCSVIADRHRSAMCSTMQLCRGKGAFKVLGTLLVIAAAGAAGLYYKQEMDKKPRTQHEVLVIDDNPKGPQHHSHE